MRSPSEFRALRERCGFSQAQVASGVVAQPHLCRYETGHRLPPTTEARLWTRLGQLAAAQQAGHLRVAALTSFSQIGRGNATGVHR
jgi:transcriptional regulator with XRE-family HTH domain